ncbi:MAG: hypothetical protein AABY64_14110 [Bdellovibrionota bacterium]
MKKFIGLCVLSMTLFATASFSQEINKTETIVGIGATLEKLPDGSVQINHFVSGAPAERSGLMIKDLIYAVKALPDTAMVSVLSLPLNDVVSLIRGPVGVPVEIHFKRGDAPEAVVSIIREKFEISDDE